MKAKIEKNTSTESHYKLKQVKACSKDEAERIITSLGFDLNAWGDVKCCCPIHDGDNPTGFSYYGKERIWSCFTHHCQKTYGNDLVGLIRGVKKCNFNDAIKYAEQFLENSTKEEDELDHQIFLSKNQIRLAPNFQYDLSKHKLYTQPLLEKGFVLQTIQSFNPVNGEDIDPSLSGRYALPIIDCNNKVLGFTARRINDSLNIKWMHFPKGIEKENILYGANLAQEYIKETKKVFLVEGPHDVMKMHQNGRKNTVGLLGTSISVNQIKLILKMGAKEVYIFMDPDPAGIKSSGMIFDKVNPYFKTTNLTILAPKEPGDMSQTEMETLCKHLQK